MNVLEDWDEQELDSFSRQFERFVAGFEAVYMKAARDADGNVTEAL
jgi:hypothetical protein